MQPTGFQEIRAAIAEYLANATWTPLDRTYVLLREAVIEELMLDFEQWLAEQGIGLYELEKGDCDDFAWLFRAFVIIRNWKQRLSNLPVCVLYGHYWLNANPTEKHAINFLPVRDDRGRIRLRPVEPQHRTGRIEMTAAERQTADFTIG